MLEDVGRRLLGPDKVKPGEKIMAGEDFAFYQQLIPGVMFGIGIRNEKAGSVHSAHNPYFFVDEMSFHLVLPCIMQLQNFISLRHPLCTKEGTCSRVDGLELKRWLKCKPAHSIDHTWCIFSDNWVFFLE
jgi:hypothetical protein